MKKFNAFKIGIFALLITPIIYAQETPEKGRKETIKIRIETKGENGEVKVTERIIDASDMTEQEKEKVLDSLVAGKNKKVTVHIDKHVNKEDRFSADEYDFWGERDPQVFHYKDRKMNKGGDLEMEIDRIIGQADRFARELPRKIERNFPSIYSWNGNLEKNKTIQNLDVFPNRPSNDLINVRFFAPEKGDVTISVLTTTGDRVAQETIKDFEGDYTGQIKVKNFKEDQAYFILVSQGEDGSSQKLIVE